MAVIVIGLVHRVLEVHTSTEVVFFMYIIFFIIFNINVMMFYIVFSLLGNVTAKRIFPT